MAHITSANGKFHVHHNARHVGTFPTKQEALDYIKSRRHPKINEERLAEVQQRAKEKAQKAVKAVNDKIAAAKPKKAKAAKKKAVKTSK